MGTSLAVVAGPIGRGLDGKRKVESETAVSCAGDSQGSGEGMSAGPGPDQESSEVCPRSQVSTFTQARSPMRQLFLTPWG